MFKKNNLILLVCFFINKELLSQKIERYNSFRYNVNQGLLQSNVLDMAFDQNNFCWLSFANGIQKFDGKNFSAIPTQAGLPDDKSVKFFQSKSGAIFFSHSRGISRYDIETNHFQMVYGDEQATVPPWFLGEDENSIFFINSNGVITGINNRNYKITSSAQLELPRMTINLDYVKISDNIINHSVSILINSTLYLWDLKQKKLRYRSAPIADISIFFLRMTAEDKVLYYNVKADPRLQQYNYTNARTLFIFQKQKSSTQPFRSIIFPWKNTLLFSLYNGLYQMDTGFGDIEKELVNFQNKPLTGNSSIARIKEDHFGNLYLVTINDGFTKVIRNNLPIKYYGTSIKEDNYVLSIFADKKQNRILSGTHGNGLLIFDTLQQLVKHFKNLPGKSIGFSVNTILKNNKGEYILFIWGYKAAWKVAADLSKLSAVKIVSAIPQPVFGISYFGNPVFQNDRQAVTLSQNMFYRINFSANTITEQPFSNQNPMSGMLYRNSILTHANDALAFFDTATLAERKRIAFKNTGGVRSFAMDNTNTIYLGTNKGIFNIDSTGKILFHLDKKSGLPDECIYAMEFDPQQNLWCSTNKGIFRLNKDKSITQLKKEDGLQENEFNTNTVAVAEDGELFFGGVNGISSFFPAAIGSLEERINLFVTGIKINNKEAFTDTAVWEIKNLKFPYHQNLLSFDFITMANNNPGQYIHQYKMEGIDEGWIQNNDLQTVRYFLPPGKYKFQMYASRSFEKDAKPMKEINITIHPPFWKTWWFITGMAILALLLVTLLVSQYIKSRYRKRLIMLEGENKIRIERERISRDLHDSLGAYANAVLYNTDLLQQKENAPQRDELIKDLRFAAKDIITALRETIWALKKDSYTAEECMLRIKNFIQPFSQYYKHLLFKFEGDVPEKKLQHNKAFHLVRIVQEAVSNAIKHADAKSIIITSSMENNYWKLVINDDGKGFDYTTTKEMQLGNGLNNMQQRAAEGEFNYSIYSIKNVGTTITITL